MTAAACPACGYSPLEAAATKCPQCGVATPNEALGETRKTRLENINDMRRWTAAAPKAAQKQAAGKQATEKQSPEKPAARAKQKTSAKAEGKADAAPPPAASTESAQPFRPSTRPPMLLVCIVDEGNEGGEWRRVRSDHAIIGRADGDIIVPHDNGISSRHAELRRVPHNGRFRWLLRDLKSTNGTFVRAVAAPLDDQQEFVVGVTRFRLELSSSSVAANNADTLRTTSHWQAADDDSTPARPVLIELHSKGQTTRHELGADEIWIGSDPSCQIVLSSDPYVSRRHARVVRNKHGRWELVNHQSLNGTWLRITEVPIDSTAEFQAGEQRFLVKVC